jgi:hypothetical protein
MSTHPPACLALTLHLRRVTLRTTPAHALHVAVDQAAVQLPSAVFLTATPLLLPQWRL